MFLLGILFCPTIAGAAVLAPDQARWLEKHNNTLIVRPEKSYPPFSFVSSAPSIRPKGLAVDYLELVARKIGAQPTYLEAKSRSIILSELKSGKEGVILALSESQNQDDSFYFSEPFISLPAVIVTRKDYLRSSKELTLADFNGKQLSMTEGYSVMDYVKNNYQRVIIEPTTDDEVALQKVLLGEVDGAVMDLASLSYYTSRDMLSYVVVAGQTGFDYKLSFAVPRSMPDLQVILNAGLKEVTPSEQQIIKDRWITFPSHSDSPRSFWALFFTSTPLWIGLSVLGAVIIIVLLISIIIHTRRHHSLHIDFVSRTKEREHALSKLNDQLKELENTNAVLGQNMQEIKSLEKTIQEKIEEIKPLS